MENLEKCRELFLTDEKFQKKLKAAAEAYTGEQTEEAIFNSILVPLAAEYGITATFDEFKDYIASLNNGAEMSKDELCRIAGGKVNGGGVGINQCNYVGLGLGVVASSESGGVCVLIGGGGGADFCWAGGEGGTACITAGESW